MEDDEEYCDDCDNLIDDCECEEGPTLQDIDKGLDVLNNGINVWNKLTRPSKIDPSELNSDKFKTPPSKISDFKKKVIFEPSDYEIAKQSDVKAAKRHKETIKWAKIAIIVGVILGTIYILVNLTNDDAITYSFILPTYEHQITDELIIKAFDTWEELNPNKLAFKHVEADGDIQFKFSKDIIKNYGVGVTQLGCTDDCIIFLALGKNNCAEIWRPFDSKSLYHNLMHEIGHTFIFDTENLNNSKPHTLQYGHLFESNDADSYFYNDYGYNIPIDDYPSDLTLEYAILYDESLKYIEEINIILTPYNITYNGLADYANIISDRYDVLEENKLLLPVTDISILVDAIKIPLDEHGKVLDVITCYRHIYISR